MLTGQPDLYRHRQITGDAIFRVACILATGLALGIILLMIFRSLQTTVPVFQEFGIIGFITGTRWAPSFTDLRRASVHLRHVADQRAGPAVRRSGGARRRAPGDRDPPRTGWPADCDRRRPHRGGPLGCLGPVGPVGPRPVPPPDRERDRRIDRQVHPVPRATDARAELLRGRRDRRVHDRPDHRGGQSRGVLRDAEPAARGSPCPRRHAMGCDPPGRPADRPDRPARSHHPRPRSSDWGDDRGHARDRQLRRRSASRSSRRASPSPA